MIAALPETEQVWLRTFFSAPNGLTWDALAAGAARQDQADSVAPLIATLSGVPTDAPIIAPFYRDEKVAGWYATSRTREGEQSLPSTLRAWLGASHLTTFEVAGPSNPSAAILLSRFGREVLSFTGPETEVIAARLALFARLQAQRPHLALTEPRPVGRIRADLEGALAIRNEPHALALITELRQSGRLNEENIQFLDIRLKAGLGQWEQIALDHWAIRNLSDLPLPPQTLSDLVEALYRVHIDGLDAGDPQTVLSVFEAEIYSAFPRLFASRHGVRTPRVVKAFILVELLQARPNPSVLATLTALLSEEDRGWAKRFVSDRQTDADDRPAGLQTSPPSPTPGEAVPPREEPSPAPPPKPVSEDVVVAPSAPSSAPKAVQIDEAQLAYDDGQIDRAFEIDLSNPLTRKSLMRLLACAQFIGTAQARISLLEAFDAQPGVGEDLSESQRERLAALRQTMTPTDSEGAVTTPAGGWLGWAEGLKVGQNLATAVTDALDNGVSWETTDLRTSPTLCGEFADLIGNLEGSAADIARQSLPLIMSAFFPEAEPPSPATKPLANVVLLLIAMDDVVARSDLETLGTVVSVLMDLGLSASDYLDMVRDLEAIQVQVGSFASLAWSLDICELLAVSPTPSAECDAARLRFFLTVVGQCQSFAHRLSAADYLPIEFLARDFDVDPTSIAGLRPAAQGSPDEASVDLAGKLIGIYTLTETAGARAKAVLLTLFPGVRIEVNSDKVKTPSLSNLARTADIFVFAWRSSSHQAFFCVKDALAGRDPTYAAGKGTASIVNAVREAAV
ncbi:MAG: hypothetical protein EON59_01510 [Alphaproteobacteria bacterium]|nr:MAG: hypothetical protein EON59_01510 [Alphaproteobacteria bacterium]